MHTVERRILCFGTHTLDPQRCVLLRGNEPIVLRPKAFDVLRYLVEHPGRLVGKDELIEAVWPGVSVTDDSLVQCVRDVRRALGDQSHWIVRTVSRRGYLFAAEVAEVTRQASTPSIEARGQEITFCRTADGVNIAIGRVGLGMPLVRTATWFNHLDHEWQNPLRAPLLNFLADRYRLIRYDCRGTGLSDRDIADISFEGLLHDLEAVVDGLGLDRYALIGTSQGAALAVVHAVRYAHRVSRLVLHGGSVRGRKRRDSPTEREMADALLSLMRQGWGDEHSVFMRMFSSRYMPNGSVEQIKWLARLQEMATSRETAVRMRMAWDEVDITDFLPKVSVPTLVLHCVHDNAVPFDEGRRLAASIPNARFVALESENHLPIPGEPAWPTFLAEIEAFLSG
jgi:DNA-binding winged helix-turn-helix (wHTH) protein/pimeloyl-ACP methyl ester carboxylesterase